jgi:hypothetical protein
MIEKATARNKVKGNFLGSTYEIGFKVLPIRSMLNAKRLTPNAIGRSAICILFSVLPYAFSVLRSAP